MSLKERTYSVLIVSASKSFNDAALYVFSFPKFDPVTVVSSLSAARRAFAGVSFDLVIINAPLPDEMGTGFAIDVCSSKHTVALLAAPAEIHEELFEELSAYGVFMVSKPLTRSSLNLAANWLQSARERLRAVEKKSVSINEKMEEIRLVNRAKWLLIHELKMDEPTAHRYIEKQAMDRSTTKAEIARGIIQTYSGV